MRRIIIAAAVLLTIQIGLVFYVNSIGNRYEAFSPEGHLFTFSPEAASSVTFIDGSEQELTLEKESGSWQLVVQSTPPADENQVKQLLKKLAGMKESLAVATSTGAAKRFKVSEDLFEHHIIVKEGDTEVVDLYIGTSPGFRHVHARVDGQQEILSLPLMSSDLSPTIENWVNKEMLQVKKEDLQQIKMAAFSLVKKEKEWQLAEASENQQLKNEEVEQFVGKLAGLNIQTVLNDEEATEILAKDPYLEYTLTHKEKGTITYSFTKSDEGYFVLRVSDRTPYFKVPEWIVNDIADISKDDLVKAVPVEEQERGGEHTS